MILNNCRLISNVKLLYPVILIEICFNSCVPDNNSSEKGIKETMHTLPLKNEQYWDDPEFMISDKKYERMINCIDGFLVDAPEIVFLDKHQSVPMICLHTAETSKFIIHSLKTTTYLVHVYLETGKIEIVKLADSPVIKDARKHPPGFSSRVLTIDLQKKLSLGTLPGKHNIMLLCGPEISNNQVIEIIPGSKKEDIDNYKKQIEQLNNESMPLPFKKAYTELKIKHHELTESDNEKQKFEVSKIKENETDYRLTVDYSIAGLKRFLFAEELPKTPDGDDVFASLPVGIAVFNKDRVFVLFKEMSLPVIAKPEEKNGVPVFSGKVSFLLSSLLFDIIDAGVDLEELTIWFISMKNTAKVEIIG